MLQQLACPGADEVISMALSGRVLGADGLDTFGDANRVVEDRLWSVDFVRALKTRLDFCAAHAKMPHTSVGLHV